MGESSKANVLFRKKSNARRNGISLDGHLSSPCLKGLQLCFGHTYSTALNNTNMTYMTLRVFEWGAYLIMMMKAKEQPPCLKGWTPYLLAPSTTDLKRHLSLLFSSPPVLKMKSTLATALLFVVALASTAFAKLDLEAVNRCLNAPVDTCLNDPNCVTDTNRKHITCTSITHSWY